jgi:hypothetical protein
MKPMLRCAGVLSLVVFRCLAADPAVVPTSPASADPEEILVLPPVVVKGSFPAKGWVYARAGRTEVFSQLSVKETRVLLDDFLNFQDFVQAHFPEASLPVDQTVTVVLCDRTRSFRMFGGGEDRTSSSLPGSSRFILVDGAEARRPEQVLRRRYISLAFDRHPPGRYPLWRQLGTREILARVIIRETRLEIGLRYRRFFAQQRGPDLTRLLSLTWQSPEFADPKSWEAGEAYYHAEFFMHMCLFGATPPYRDLRKPYEIFIRRLEQEPLTEELFRECFGRDFAAMNYVFRAYITGENVKFESRHFRFTASDPFEVRRAEPAEVLGILQEAQALRPPGTPSDPR